MRDFNAVTTNIQENIFLIFGISNICRVYGLERKASKLGRKERAESVKRIENTDPSINKFYLRKQRIIENHQPVICDGEPGLLLQLTHYKHDGD